MITGFGEIWALGLLACAAAMAWWYSRTVKRDARARDAFADGRMHVPLGLGPVGRRSLAGPAAVVAAVLFASLSIARPLGPPDPDAKGGAGMDVIVALDISDSMAVPDMGGSRLAAAKAALAGLVAAAPSNRYGLVLFSGEAVVSCPLTVDHGAFLTFLDGAGFSRTGLPGTAMGEAVLTAATRFKPGELPRVVLVVTDGENTYGADPLEAAKAAAGRGLKVYALGVGTSGGGQIPMGRDFFGGLIYKRDRTGAVVNSALDEGALKRVAAAGSGEYFNAGDGGSVKGLARTLRVKEMKEVGGVPPDAKELGPYFALGAFALLVAAVII